MKNKVELLKKLIYQRRIRILAGGLLLLLEMALLVWPVGWMKEEKMNSLTGIDAWTLTASRDNNVYCQEIVPEHKRLKNFSVVLTMEGEALAEGSFRAEIISQKGESIFSEEYSYADMKLDEFYDIRTDVDLKAGSRYYLTLTMEPDAEGRLPSLRVCGMEQHMPENKVLTQGSIIEGAQLVSRYVYTDAIEAKKVVKAFLLGLLAALGIMIGLPDKRAPRNLVGMGILVLLPYVLGRRLELLTINLSFFEPSAMLGNMAIMYLLEAVVLLCSCSLRFTTTFVTAFLTIIYSVNYYVYAFRGTAFKLNEITAVRTAAQVVGNYDLRPNTHLAMAWCIAVLFVVWGINTGKWRIPKRTVRGASAAAGILLAAVAGWQLLYTDFLEDKGFVNFSGFETNLNYHFNGFAVATCFDLKNSRIEKPDNYSVEAVERILEQAGENAVGNVVEETEDLPHVILIMNESFADLRVLGNLQLSEENLSFFNSLSENTVRGYVNSSVLGGGTANSEFEVFTGCSMGLLPDSYYPYQRCITRPANTLISMMKENGYTTYSMHPETAKNWNRDKVYQYFNFDYSLWGEDFGNARQLHYGATDGETYRKVEEIFENRKDGERLFIFDLTIQNHGGYSKWEGEESVVALNAPSEEAETYLSLIKASDEDFRELIQYFEKQDEKVIVCMFGDHQPKLSDESFYESIYVQTEDLTQAERLMNQYKTPFVIWANYEIEKRQNMDISLNYLGVLLMDVAGLRMSDYYLFLREQMKEYPIITINGYVDAQGSIHEWSGENTEFSDYRMLQYNYLFDRDIRSEGFR